MLREAQRHNTSLTHFESKRRQKLERNRHSTPEQKRSNPQLIHTFAVSPQRWKRPPRTHRDDDVLKSAPVSLPLAVHRRPRARSAVSTTPTAVTFPRYITSSLSVGSIFCPTKCASGSHLTLATAVKLATPFILPSMQRSVIQASPNRHPLICSPAATFTRSSSRHTRLRRPGSSYCYTRQICASSQFLKMWWSCARSSRQI